MKRPDKSYITAIGRNKLPRPTRILLELEKLNRGKILDFGCGHCAKVNKAKFKGRIDNYDPYFEPGNLEGKQYDIIICNYVLCVLDTLNKQFDVLYRIIGLLKGTGKAYITVRRNSNVGYTGKGTYQGICRLNCPTIYKCRDFEIYEMKTQWNIH